jgi:D-alanyl-D-alanine carboxypeptidase
VPVVPTIRTLVLTAAFAATVLASGTPARAASEAMLLVEADTGKVLHAENASLPWYPASLTKLMTAYVTLQAVRNHRITLDTLLKVSPRAAAQQPSKMGFKPGTQVTVDNALKMLMVKSANDIAVVLAEGVSGSVDKFSEDMNRAAKRLGMTQSNWVNPNGLPAENQVTSARDLAILARALLHEFPEYELYWGIPAIKFGKRVMRNYNTLIGRFTGADGMKTGFICASGFNLVASATRGGKQLIAVVLGAPSSPVRAVKAATLLERGFNRGPLAWLAPSLGTVDTLKPINTAPPDLRDEMCGAHRKRPAAESADDEPGSENGEAAEGYTLSSLPAGNGKPSSLIGPRPAVANPIVVHAGPSKRPAETQFSAVRARLAKAGKLPKSVAKTDVAGTAASDALKRDPHTAPLPPSQPGSAVTASVKVAPGAAAATGTPGAANAGNPPWMSFAPAARAETTPAPLTAMPGAAPDPQAAMVPLPRARPKVATAKRRRR